MKGLYIHWNWTRHRVIPIGSRAVPCGENKFPREVVVRKYKWLYVKRMHILWTSDLMSPSGPEQHPVKNEMFLQKSKWISMTKNIQKQVAVGLIF